MTDIYRAGVGRVVVRGAWTVEELGRGRQQLVITSLPYADTTTGSTEKFIAAVGDAIDEGNLAGIVDYNDESSDGATRITIGLTTGVAAEQIIPALLRFTNLQVTNKVQMHFLDEHGSVRLYNLRSCLQAWIDHRVRVVVRRSENRLAKIDDRLHRLRGFLAVLIDIDRTIQIVRIVEDPRRSPASPSWPSSTSTRARPTPCSTSTSASSPRTRSSSSARRPPSSRRRPRSSASCSRRPRALRRQVGTELEQVIPQFDGVAPRVTTITTEAVQRVSKAAMVLDEPVTVLVDAAGYVQAQRAGSKAKPKLEPLRTFDTSTAQNLVVITSGGQLHRALAATVPTDKPTAAVNVFAGLDPADRILGWWADQSIPTDLLLVMSDGQVKRIEGDDLAGGDRKGGISLVKMAPGAHVVPGAAFDGRSPAADRHAGRSGRAVRRPTTCARWVAPPRACAASSSAPGDAWWVPSTPPTTTTCCCVVQAKGAAKRVLDRGVPGAGPRRQGREVRRGDGPQSGPVDRRVRRHRRRHGHRARRRRCRVGDVGRRVRARRPRRRRRQDPRLRRRHHRLRSGVTTRRCRRRVRDRSCRSRRWSTARAADAR